MDFQSYKQILRYFTENKVDYVLLRYPHIIKREIHDLDILIGKREDYRKIMEYLQAEKFICLEKEAFRRFWAKKIGKELVVLDIYNRISWLGWTMLDKNQILCRKRKPKGRIAVCSDEDELLVYMAQALFKNNGLDEYKTALLRILMKKKLDWNYIIQQMKRHRWLAPGKKLLSNVRKSEEKIIARSKADFFDTLLCALTFKRSCSLSLRMVKMMVRTIFQKPKAVTVCLLGPDGSGKSTLAKQLKEEYQRFFKKFSPKTNIVYFGWKPFLPTTKLLSSLFKKRNYNVVEKSNTRKRNTISKSFFRSALFSYFFLEYLARYLWIIFPQRNKKRIMLLDRYFYDIYAHYQDAERSSFFCLLLKLFPRPDYTFLLEVPVERLLQRKQEMSKEQLQKHQERYQQLQKIIPLYRVDATKNIEVCKDEIISKTWRKISRRIK